jgi:hypothetical protein
MVLRGDLSRLSAIELEGDLTVREKMVSNYDS